MADEQSDPILANAIRGWIHVAGVIAVSRAIVNACDEIAEREHGKPAGTIASINANLVRQAVGRMVG